MPEAAVALFPALSVTGQDVRPHQGSQSCTKANLVIALLKTLLKTFLIKCV